MDIEKLNRVVQAWWNTENLLHEGVEVTIRITLSGVEVFTSAREITLDELLTKEKFEEAGLPTKIYLHKLRHAFTYSGNRKSNHYINYEVSTFVREIYSSSQKAFTGLNGMYLGQKTLELLTHLLQYYKFME